MENTQENETLKPEQMELRPEDLVSGEVYTFSLPKNDWKWTFKFKGLNLEKKDDQIEYYRLYVHHDKELIINSSCSHREKYYHATPDEKALLLGEEEPTDWKTMYHELKAKYDQLQPKCEKVYFYFDYLDNLIKTTDFDFALHESSEDSPIYTGVFMGKKKSVLVNE